MSRHLVTSAEEEGRVILTADTTFLRARWAFLLYGAPHEKVFKWLS